jgi:hypothetical protein
MSVDTFDPRALGKRMDETAVQDLCAIAAALKSDELTLSELEIARFAPLASHSEWAERAQALPDTTLVALIRLFTLGEMQYPSWNAGDKSPVVAMVKILKARNSYQIELTRWIKAHTTNKYLPHGNLMDRL